MRVAVVLALLTGCSFPTKPGEPFACNGDPLPLTAPDPIHIHATVVDPVTRNPVPAAIIATYNGIVIHGATDGSGVYDTELTTLGVPHPAFIEADPDDTSLYANTIEYPALPISSDQDSEILVFQKSEFKDPMTGDPVNPNSLMLLAVVDCNNMPVGGATVSVTNKTTPSVVVPLFYITGDFSNLDPTVTSTVPGIGLAVALGVLTPPPAQQATFTIDASLTGVTFQSHDITPSGTALTLAEISP